MKNRYLDDFQRIRSFSDELPEERVTAEDGGFKCRGNTMTGIAHRAENLLKQGLIQDPAAIEATQKYLDYVGKRDFSIFSTQQDIDEVNKALDVLIEALQ